MPRLSPKQIQSRLPSLPAWRKKGNVLSRSCSFKDFAAAIRFVNAVARLAEKANHHPDIDIRWNKVVLTLTTHDQGGLTEKDFVLAAQCERLIQPPSER